ncbi:MAG: hypothetical protein U5R49_16320 [Deltaproteobacteria bacterium]|nr:hypothetical protein [Deltaproteobacteria bacterium]
MKNQELNYNILVIDDDPLVLEDAVLMYRDMIFLGDFADILGDDAKGSVSSAKNTRDAEKILRDNFEKDPSLVQLLHVDERMPEERGSEFVDRMRWAYAGRRIGALLVTGYATDVSVANSREKGVYRYVSKPVTPALIKPHLDDLVKVIFSKEKPQKREITNTFVFKQITDKEQLIQYFQLRYSVFDFMSYLQQKNDQRLDIDKFDPYSRPYGGFVVNDDGSETIVTTIRTITTERQEPYDHMIQEIVGGSESIPVSLVDGRLDHGAVRTLHDFVSQSKSHDFLVAESFDVNSLLQTYRQENIPYGEYSRIIDHTDYRGYSLSKMAILTAIADSRLRRSPQMIFGACVPQHAKMYGKYGWRFIRGTDLSLEQKVQQVAKAMVSDVFNDVPKDYDSVIKESILPQLKENRQVIYPFS